MLACGEPLPVMMPTVSRFLVRLAILVAIAYAVMLGLAYFVKPHQGEMTVDVPLDKVKSGSNL
ncbi:histidine kinase [Pseudaminobacter soli (ex Zhang et al. 2022)]|nr:histidine kinase [Pseudaminobacter soli]